MPAERWNELDLHANRLNVFEWAAYDQDGDPVEFAATDKARFKLADTEGGPPLLDLISGSLDSNGSTVTIDDLGDEGANPPEPARGTVRIGMGSTSALTAGRKFGELLLVDDSETAPPDAIKVIERGTFKLRQSIGGPIGL